MNNEKTDNLYYEDEVDLIDLFKVLLKRKFLIFNGVVVLMLLALIYLYFAPSVYKMTTIVESAILEINDESEKNYVSTPSEIKNRIELGLYNKKIKANITDKENLESQSELEFEIKTIDETGLVKISYEDISSQYGLKVLKELVKQLRAEDQQVLRNRKNDIETELNLIKTELEKNNNTNKVLLINIENIEQRVKQLTSDIEKAEANNIILSKEHNIFLRNKKTYENSMSMLLYNNTIQQTLYSINLMKNQLTEQKKRKENEVQNIIVIQMEIGKKKIDISLLQHKMDIVKDLSVIIQPYKSKYPVKPRKIIILLATFFGGLLIMISIALISEYIRKNFKNEAELEDESGFSLIELLVVIVIIGLLSSLVAPKFFGKIDKAKVETTNAQIELLGSALDSYRLDNDGYPSTEQGLDALRKKPDNLESWSGPYLPKPVPPDAWNRKYFYKSPGDHGRYDLYSYGRDGKEGGKEYLDKDIVSWE